MNKINNNEIGICPYNPSHKFPKSKTCLHINRCKDKLKYNGELSTCKGNFAVLFPKEEKENHVKNCKSCTRYENSNEFSYLINSTTFKNKINERENEPSIYFNLDLTEVNPLHESRFDISVIENQSYIEDESEIAVITDNLSRGTELNNTNLY